MPHHYAKALHRAKENGGVIELVEDSMFSPNTFVCFIHQIKGAQPSWNLQHSHKYRYQLLNCCCGVSKEEF